jgi:hypothetical protein
MLGLMVDDNTPTPEAVAHAMLEEVTKTHRLRRPTPQEGSPRTRPSWHWVTIFLTSVLAVGTLVSVLGSAFFVRREEYTSSETANVVSHEALRQTLDRVDRTLAAQTLALTKMSEALQAQAVELATIKYRSNK